MRSIAKVGCIWEAHGTRFCQLEVEHSIYDVDVEADEPQILNNAKTRGFGWVMGKWSYCVPLDCAEGDLVEVEYVDAGYWKVLSQESVTRLMRPLRKGERIDVGDVLVEHRRSLPRWYYVVDVGADTVSYSRLPVEVDRCDATLLREEISNHFKVYTRRSILDLR